ncbi:MAG: hypothetical protein A2161_04740 [Candidatus Schekmanbacteria bacterium RBG_13_48_7]|uniref:Uncharacterized protein n=1 Tax=Candidatus Schekmanbacteria bacterium RBG_13_48_7 TaxID=1817878 RepID=A0A1F7RT24_9BACT|nr:MAG: hypothetical protein A2161_04740 [Candidatus Schekmanbacteria bacterium RBG_13_48_7]
MLLALGVNPACCGYNENQIEYCLNELGSKELHQEKEGANHVKSLLIEKGFLSANTPTGKTAKKHPEIMKLRFDPVKSDFNTIPYDLREPFYKIVFQHADGAVQKTGRTWVKINPLEEQYLKKQYQFESSEKNLHVKKQS